MPRYGTTAYGSAAYGDALDFDLPTEDDIVQEFRKDESTAARRAMFVLLLDSNDHVTPKSGLSPTVTLCKSDETAYSAIAGSVAEIESTGTYKISLAAADLDTEGLAMVQIAASGADTAYRVINVATWIDDARVARACLANKRTHTVATGVDVYKDNDAVTTLLTQTPSEASGVITITPS